MRVLKSNTCKCNVVNEYSSYGIIYGHLLLLANNLLGNNAFSFHFSFLLTLGPPLPKPIHEFSMLEMHGDVYVFGGDGGDGPAQSAIYRLSCSSGTCSWSTLNQQLKVSRRGMVVIPVPDHFCT